MTQTLTDPTVISKPPPKSRRVWSRHALWKAAPPWVKRLGGALLGLAPAQYLLGGQFRGMMAFLDDAQWWNHDRIRAYQLERLGEIVQLAQQRSPFYQRMFDDAGFDATKLTDVEQIASLPTIDGQIVRENVRDMCVVAPDSPGVDMVSTGGTGNAPLQFYIDRDRSAVEYAHLVSGWRRIGYDVNTPMAVFRGRVVEHDKRLGFRHEYDPILRHHYYSNFHMSEDNMGRYLDHLSRQRPLFLHCYPSSAAALARYIQRTGRDAPANVRGVIAESEIVYPEQRELIESTIGKPLFSSYGHSEKLVAAAGCEHSNHAHVWPTYGYFELLDDRGQPISTPGQRGEIVGTGFINRVMPFIRYRTGDMATLVADRCAACGRNQTVIKEIRGHRTQEMLVTKDGSQIGWTALNMHDDTFNNVRQFQFYQDTPGRAVLKIAPSAQFGDEDRTRMIRNLSVKFDGQVTFEVETVDEIKLTTRGKAVYVDQRIKPEVPVVGGEVH